MDGLTWKEVILGILLPLVLGSYAYSWYGFGKLWEALEKRTDRLREELKGEMKEMRENDIRHLEERVAELEK